ncbi:phosphotransferase family enzyme [Kribbella pratensis]|uniref:Phosphotransferase family enzyme n=1 Tax=Kribbella pratensis TaxID=2512112 RepID=A0ABY2FHN4_9ACTN|nr:aminoglycoside phosphotransferase family protein [Kribbella pratensis]TDW90625.1 phosphotransferase family enzyme [Kribbella pratensis]
MAAELDFLDQVAAVARRHGVGPGELKEVAGGVANRGFVLGDELFLRVCRPGYEADLLKETHVVPAARSVGVLTPAIVEYDDSRRLIAAPYAVMERVHGTEPTELPTALAEQLARLHQLKRAPESTPNRAKPASAESAGPESGGAEPARAESRSAESSRAESGRAEPAGAVSSGAESSGAEPVGAESSHAASGCAGSGCAESGGAGGGLVGVGLLGVVEDGWGDPWRTIDELAERGYVDPGTASWLTGWFTRLAEHIDGSRPNVLIHGDVAAHNLLAGPDGDLRALIDWGDAAWAPPAMDFAKLPLTQVAALLPDYLRHAHSPESEEEFAAAVLWFHLFWALAKLPAAPWPGQRHWTAPTTSRLLNILHFFTTSPPAPWSGLT